MGRKRSTPKGIKEYRMEQDYRNKYSQDYWLDFMMKITEEYNPQMLYLFIGQCLNVAGLALHQFKDIPHPEHLIPESLQEFLKSYEAELKEKVTTKPD